MSLEIVFPWVVTAQKNSRVNIPGGGTAPNAKAVAQREAVAAVAVVAVARSRGIISAQAATAIERLAAARCIKGSGVGAKRLDQAVANVRGGLRAVFGSHDVAVRLVEDIAQTGDAYSTRVEVHDLGAPPRRKRKGRHDLANAFELVLDALQGVAYDNDRQVLEVSGQRTFGGEAPGAW